MVFYFIIYHIKRKIDLLFLSHRLYAHLSNDYYMMKRKDIIFKLNTDKMLI